MTADRDALCRAIRRALIVMGRLPDPGPVADLARQFSLALGRWAEDDDPYPASTSQSMQTYDRHAYAALADLAALCAVPWHGRNPWAVHLDVWHALHANCC